MKVTRTHISRFCTFTFFLLLASAHSAWAQDQPAHPNNNNPGLAQQASKEKEEAGIQDNSFLVEEAYNQEYGVVQHIQTFQRFWNTHSWGYSYTNEWPVDAAPRHQLSYTVPVMNLADGSGTGLGDIALNYRYQLIGNGEAKVAFAPRFTLLVPTGDYKRGQGAGATGYQGMLPVSWVHNQRFTTHWNRAPRSLLRRKIHWASQQTHTR